MHNWIKLHTEIKLLKDEQKAAITFISKASCLIWIHRDERVKQSYAERRWWNEKKKKQQQQEQTMQSFNSVGCYFGL